MTQYPSIFEEEIHQKLLEAELQAQATEERLSHEDVISSLREMVNTKSGSDHVKTRQIV